ncbi:carboxypeptidase M32 [Halolamina litorea]|uniref:Metal-dependent carboxypeptidase n=1 Tax=Halolamina litorea TaxID=1515593 RepID=A0ABD6BVP9_9EURY|nr:carboxypeptidase M32 [Halolamina litorea]
MSDSDSAYDRLHERAERVGGLETIDNLLFWDQQVMMPSGGTPGRSMQRGLVSALQHEAFTGDDVAGWLDAVDDADLDDDQQAIVREVRREHERKAAVDRDLIEETNAVISEANDAWETAREEDDFEVFAPYLEQLVELKREYANQIDPDAEPFSVILEEYEPYVGVDTAESILDSLRERLVPLIEEIRESDVDLGGAFVEHGPYDDDRQMALSEDALSFVGCDWDRSRLDTSTHPFSYGNRYDMRITTRFHDHSPVDGLMSSLHEYGHASYEHGLDEDRFPDPLGQSRSHSIHESQSRFWENHVGRSEAFWGEFLPIVRKHFPRLAEVSPREAFEAANQVYEDNLTRVEADEVTYHLHILVRFEIERALVNGDLDVADVPAVWNDKYEQYLGITPENDTVGCLQDIHWSIGRIGTFQGYTLGTVFSAQLQEAMEAELGADLEELVGDRRFDDMRTWMNENVHQHGKRYRTDELAEVATGKPLTADPFLDRIESKYRDLYDL